MAISELASVDGTITPTEEAVLPLRDDGLYRGDGAFEVIRLYEGLPFALEDHLDRLTASASRLHLEFDRARLEEEIDALLEQSGTIDAQLRLIVTRGGRRIAATEALASYDSTIDVATVEYSPTIILNGVKSLSYAANMHATRLAQEAGAEEAVLVTREGTVLEPPTSGIFWVTKTGKLRTTELSAGILNSITRERIMRDMDAETGAWPVQDLLAADEAFLVSTTREIQPVGHVNGEKLPTAPGTITAEAQERFRARVSRELAESRSTSASSS